MDENGRVVLRRSFTTTPAADKALKHLQEKYDMTYSDAVNLMIDRGMAIEACYEANFPVVAKTPEGEHPFTDDRPVKRSLVDGELAKRLKLLK